MKTLAFLVGLFTIGATLGAACDQTKPTAAQVAAESAYGAALLRCVDSAKTLAESKSCRAKVDADWNIVQTEAGAK